MITQINATTIEDAWRQAIYNIDNDGCYNIYKIDTGSFEGHRRLEYYPLVVITINAPYTRPLEVTVPEGKNIPAPSSEHYTIEYLDKLINPNSKFENEDYVYAQYVWPQLQEVIDKLSKGSGTNQATITVGDSESIALQDPPCLKLIDFRLTKKAVGIPDFLGSKEVCTMHYIYNLDMIVYFRSWDLWAGFPNNLAALELLREYVYMEVTGEKSTYLTNGSIIAVSKGLHLYDYCWDYVELLNGRSLRVPNRH
jgi:thymidylate synthase